MKAFLGVDGRLVAMFPDRCRMIENGLVKIYWDQMVVTQTRFEGSQLGMGIVDYMRK